MMAAVVDGDRQAVDLRGASIDAPDLRVFMFALFFIWGGITSLNDVIIPKLKDLFTLDYAQAMLVQSAFFAAYFFVSIPAAAIVRRAGYLQSATIGLLTMTAGCLLFIPASQSGVFGLFLLALFVLASGITIIQVVANPLIALLGAPATAAARLTFAQGFNSLGTTVFPYVGAVVILGSLATVDASRLSGTALALYRAQESQVVVQTYMILAAALTLVAAVVWSKRKQLALPPVEDTSILRAFDLLARPRFACGVLGIFLYVGAEVAIGSIIVNYLMEADIMGLSEQAAGKHVPLYWGGALVGRFIGAAVLRTLSPGKTLAAVATAVIALLLISATVSGPLAGWALLAIGLFNAIMFPTIFTLALAGLGDRTGEGSGLLCVAIVGGAVIPPVLGLVADATGSLQAALVVPGMCYVGIIGFGLFASRDR